MLWGREVRTRADMAACAKDLAHQFGTALLVKGGHLAGEQVSDLLLTGDGRPRWMRAARIDTPNTHGTGCTLSSAIAARLALGDDLDSAVPAAQAFIRAALSAGAKVRTGQGSGPLNHGFAPQAMQTRRVP